MARRARSLSKLSRSPMRDSSWPSFTHITDKDAAYRTATDRRISDSWRLSSPVADRKAGHPPGPHRRPGLCRICRARPDAQARGVAARPEARGDAPDELEGVRSELWRL